MPLSRSISHGNRPCKIRDVRERKKNLLRYTPDVARAVAAVLHSVHKRKRGMAGGAGDDDEEAAGQWVGA